MRKTIFFILIIAIAVLLIIPEETIGEYKGLLKAKYFLRDVAEKARNIIFGLLHGEKSEELKNIEEKIKEGKETIEKKAGEEVTTTTKKIIEVQIGVE